MGKLGRGEELIISTLPSHGSAQLVALLVLVLEGKFKVDLQFDLDEP